METARRLPTPTLAGRSTRRTVLGLWGVLAAAVAGCGTKRRRRQAGNNTLGGPVRRYGARAPSEASLRTVPETSTPEATASFTPLRDQRGILTPSALHFERHHSGVPTIDPEEHRLLVHGLVDRPLILSMEDLYRLPSVSRIHFIECAGNGFLEWEGAGSPSLAYSHGLASCSEWTGVLLAEVLSRVGVRPEASWLVAEGADPCRMSRSLPLAKAWADIILAYGQNGEAVRPEQGYPLRLVVPGWEGNVNIKWLRQIKIVDRPYMTRDETSKYTDLMPSGKARQFTFAMEAKSVITFPSGGDALARPGLYEIRGLAWSGRGTIDRVEISTDGGQTWLAARLDEPRLPMAFTSFHLPWRWDGSEATLMSRATDDTGYVQPTRRALFGVRGRSSTSHNNAIKPWQVHSDGRVENV